MTTRTSHKATAYKQYLAGCEELGLEPEFEYDDLTAKGIVKETEVLRARYRAERLGKVVTSAAKNTVSAQKMLQRAGGESMDAFRKRASSIAQSLGKAIPVRIRVERTK